MFTVKKGTIKTGILKGEKYKIKELNEKEQEEFNGYKFVVTQGEYDDIDFETETLEEALDFVMSY